MRFSTISIINLSIGGGAQMLRPYFENGEILKNNYGNSRELNGHYYFGRKISSLSGPGKEIIR